MRVSRIARVPLLGLVAALAAALSSPAPAAPATDKVRAERPVYQVGDKWVRTDGAYELVRIDKDVYVFSAGAGKEFHLTKDLGVARIVLDGRTELDIDSPPKFAWPLEVGKWGVGRAFWRSPPPRPLVSFTGTISITWQVDRAEDLATAAGTFRTLRINQKIETVSGAFGAGQQFGQVFLWYAPDVQRFVKAESNLKGLSWALGGAAPSPAPPVVASPPPAQTRPQPRSPDTQPPVAPPAPAATPPRAAVATPPSAPAATAPSAPVATPPSAPTATPPPAPAATAPSAPAATPPRAAVATPPSATAPQPVAPLRRGDIEAPKITINSPPQDAKLGEEQILITGLVTDNVEVVRVQVLVNGVEATPVREVGVTGRGVPLGAIAALKPGPNVIEVIATNKAGNVARLLRTVTRVAAARAPVQAPTSAAPPR